jgi:hypothetical protein
LRKAALASVLAACFLTSCDPSHDVSIHNAFNEPVDLYSFERKPEYRLHVEPGQTITQGWPYGWGPPRRRIEALNAAGALIFCEIVTTGTDDLGKRGWRIEIGPGHPSCE